MARLVEMGGRADVDEIVERKEAVPDRPSNGSPSVASCGSASARIAARRWENAAGRDTAKQLNDAQQAARDANRRVRPTTCSSSTA
jgi:hypothetical protein